MKNPLKPAFEKRERSTDDQHAADCQADPNVASPDFQDTTGADGNGGSHLKFTGYSPTVAIAPIQIDIPTSVTVLLTGVTSTAAVGNPVVSVVPGNHTVVGPGKTKTITEEALSLEFKKIKAEVQARHVMPFPMDAPELEPVPLFEGTTRATAWLPDPKARKVSLKRIGDENADLQEAFFEGRTKLIAWRKLCLWVWIAKLFLKSVLTPVIAALAKVPAWIWSAIVWLKFW